MNSSETITVTVAQGVMRIGINRPEKKNAINNAMYEAMGQALTSAQDDDSVGAILIHGLAEVFTAGNDLHDFDSRTPGGNHPSAGAGFLMTLLDCEKPVVAAVSGMAIGIGVTMLLHCDLVYAARDTRFSMPFVDLGLVPEAGATLLLPLMAGHRHAAESLLLGESFTTDKAIALGLVNAAFATEAVVPAALEKALALAGKPRRALRETKALMRLAGRESLARQMAAEFKLFGELLSSDEATAIRKQFLQRRR